MNREDFEILEQGIIYFDNGATTLKPKGLSISMSDYYNHYSANAHRGDYDISLRVDNAYENTRKLVQEFINAKKKEEVVFTSGTTDSLNKIVFGYFKNHLQKGDEVLLTKSEHASNVLPWFELADEMGIVIRYIELDKELKVTIEAVEKAITKNTKVISIAAITNVVGDVRPIQEITTLAHQNNILVVVDGAQSVPHMPVDVQELDIDFLTFSAHKMIGPTGVGVLYGKEKYLEETKPILFGGGMNASFSPDGTRVYEELPTRLEAGTQNIAGVIGFGYALSYLMKIGMETIHQKEAELKEYTIRQLEKVKGIIIYNEASASGIITFNMEEVFSQDLAIYLNKYHICVRAGNHCAKILKDDLGIRNTCRMSLYFYNTKDEVDKLVEALSNPNLKDEIF